MKKRITISEYKKWFENHSTNVEAQKVLKFLDERIELRKKQNIEFGIQIDLEETPSSVWYVVKKLIKTK